MKNLPIPVFLLLLVVSHISQSLTLNGIGSYQQLRKEFYIGALYLTEPSDDPQAIINSTGSKRMALKVTTKRWSPRRWSLQWQNDIAINNPFSNDKALTEQLMLFTGFIEDNLRTGDEILIDYITAKGTKVTINGVTIIQTNTDELFNYLVNVWIGKLPPSGEFKARILNQMDDGKDKELLAQYNSVTYNDQRSKMVAGWIQAKKDAELAEQRKQEQAEQKRLAKLQKAKDDAAAKALAAAEAKKQAKQKTYVAPKVVKKKKVITKKKKVASVKPSKKSKSKKEQAAEDKYYLDLYKWELVREIRKAVEYPEWAKNFGQKGTVTLNFNVNRKAEVTGVSGKNDDVSVLLVSELHRAILAVVPFILPPDALPGKSWNMSVSYEFDPRKDTQPFVKKPRKPSTLVANTKISRAQYKETLSRYIDDVKAIIVDSIEYPVWAKKLNQKGKVEIEIKVNKDGNVIDSKEVTLNRHDTLNQAVRDAIEAVQPLPPIPEELKLNHTRVLIKYNFK